MVRQESEGVGRSRKELEGVQGSRKESESRVGGHHFDPVVVERRSRGVDPAARQVEGGRSEGGQKEARGRELREG